MTTRTFNTPEELMIALLQGEKWEMIRPIEGVCYYDDLNKREPFRFIDNYRDSYIHRAYEYCDGETIWTKVEEKTELGFMKEKYANGDYTCISHVGGKWGINNHPAFVEIGNYKLIHKKHEKELLAYLADNSVEIEFSHYKDTIRFDVKNLIDSYSENCLYYLKPKKKTVSLAMFTCQYGKGGVWSDPERCSDVQSYKNSFTSEKFINHHEIPNTRYEIEVDDE